MPILHSSRKITVYAMKCAAVHLHLIHVCACMDLHQHFCGSSLLPYQFCFNFIKILPSFRCGDFSKTTLTFKKIINFQCILHIFTVFFLQRFNNNRGQYLTISCYLWLSQAISMKHQGIRVQVETGENKLLPFEIFFFFFQNELQRSLRS